MTIIDYITYLRRELGEPESEIDSPPIVPWAELLLKLALERGGSLTLVPTDAGSLRVVVGDQELPHAAWTGSALSRFLVIAGFEKGEEARSKPQQSECTIDVAGRQVRLSARTVPLGRWREEIHIELER